MVTVSSLYQFLAIFPPDLIRENSQQFDTPCPFCGEGSYVEYLGHRFYGDNRMFWIKSNETPRAICRQCMAAERGPHHGVYFLADFVDKFGAELDIDASSPALRFDAEDPHTSGEMQLPDLIPTIKRIAYYNAVDRSFWARLGFEDRTIDHFYLGFGRLYTSWDRGHLIPMDVRTATRPVIGGHYYEARIPNAEGKFDKKNSAGAKKHIFWHTAEGAPEDGVLITESPKNQLAHWQMSFTNSVTTFGSGVWKGLPDNFKYLWDYGYRKIYVVGDHDVAGTKFNGMIIEQALKLGFECYFLEWQPDMGEGYDTADLMRDYGTLRARQYMLDHFVQYTVEAPEADATKAEFIPDYTVVDPHYTPRKVTPISIEEVRGTGPRSISYAIQDYLKHYLARRKYGRGDFLLIKARPGVGKTHTLIQTAEEVARAALERKFEELKQLETEILRVQGELDETTDFEEQDVLRNLLGNLVARQSEFSFQSVFWAAQYKDSLDNLLATGANPQYYFDFQARGQNNCDNFELATKLAVKGHNIMKFCEDSCPFAERCRKMGYLAQYDQRRQSAIGVHRHQHLVVESALEGYRDLVIIDESALGIVESPVLIAPEECEPTNTVWENLMEDGVQADAMRYFASGLQHAIRFNSGEPSRKTEGGHNPNSIVSGTAFLRLLDSTIAQLSEDAWTLERVMSEISDKTVRYYQTNYVGDDHDDIQPIRLPHAYKVIERELAEYLEDPHHKRPSCLHLVSGVLEVYPMNRIHISSNVPVIVADATALKADLYCIAFGRDLASIYDPPVYNENTEVIAVHGSDWTISNIEREIGNYMRRRQLAVKAANGQEVSLEHIWEDSNLTNNALVRRYLDVITTYALLHKTDGLLVVTHKRIRPVVEPIIRKNLPQHKIAFAHYGGVRGSNKWKDYKAALLMGTPRVPYDVLWRRIQAWANMARIEDPIPFELAYVPTPYDGTNTGHTHINFTHPFAAEYVDWVEVGEAVQAQERVRPHSSHEHKKLYLFSSRPMGREISRVESKTRLLRTVDPSSKVVAISEFVMSELERTQEMPTKKIVMTQFECSHKTACQGFKLAEETLALDQSTGSSNSGLAADVAAASA